ncbi:MAG: polysaccharide deacetylase family protein [Verrucomicrobia bacterium]|nr:polysaccharide deacetylase family protein [Verrucomicrobiota bacterium]
MKVMQCWDDGDVDDIRLVEILKRHQAKATFNINPGGSKSERRMGHDFGGRYKVWRLALDEMPDVYRGFCIGGHSMTHPDLTAIDPKSALAELVDCKAYVAEHFDQTEFGMAYPGGNFNDAVKVLVRQAGYHYARTTLNVEHTLNTDDPMVLHTHCHFLNPDFWPKYLAAQQADRDFYFWGHTFELMNDDRRWDELEAMQARISEDPQSEWIDVIDLFA